MLYFWRDKYVLPCIWPVIRKGGKDFLCLTVVSSTLWQLMKYINDAKICIVLEFKYKIDSGYEIQYSIGYWTKIIDCSMHAGNAGDWFRACLAHTMPWVWFWTLYTNYLVKWTRLLQFAHGKYKWVVVH